MTRFYIHFSPQHARILQPEKTTESSRKSGLAWKVGLLQGLIDKFGLEGYPAWVPPLAKFPLSRLVSEIRLRSGTLSAVTHGTRATLCSWLTLEEMEAVTLVGGACLLFLARWSSHHPIALLQGRWAKTDAMVSWVPSTRNCAHSNSSHWESIKEEDVVCGGW